MEEDRKVSRIITGVIIFLVILLAVLLYGIYSNLTQTDKELSSDINKKTIKIWTIHGDLETLLKQVVKKYELEHEDINIEVSSFKNDIYQSTIEDAAVTNELPDIFFTWGYGVLERYVQLGLVWDITDVINQYDLKTNMLSDNVLEGVSFTNREYAIPLYGWNSCLFVNKELFEKYNLPYPKTYDEFLYTVQFFKEKGITPVAGSSKEPWLSSLYYMSLALGEGDIQGVYDVAADKTQFNTLQFYNAAKKMDQLITLEPWQENYMESDAYDAAYLFIQGEAAMLLSGSWVAASIEAPDSKVSGKVDVIPFPNEDSSTGVGGSVDVFVINNNSSITKDRELQKMYVEIMQDMAKLSVEEMGIGLPVYQNQFVDQTRFPTMYKATQITPIKGQHPAYDQIFNKQLIEVYYDNLTLLFNKEIDAEEFIKKLSE